MPNAGWYDDNMGRAYPLVATLRPDLPDDVLVDFGCLIGPQVGFTVDDTVYLHRIFRTGDSFYFEFRSTAAGLNSLRLQFCRQLTDPRFATDYYEVVPPPEGLVWETLSEGQWAGLDEAGWSVLLGDQDGSLSQSEESESADCSRPEIWSGFLVTGDLSRLADVLADGESISGGEDAMVEPTLVRNLGSSTVNAIYIANKERTRTTAPRGCRPPCHDFELETVYVQSTCLQGDVRFKPGYNSAVTQNNTENSLQFAARKGSGEGEPCEEVRLFEEETPPDGSSLLTGGPSCEDTVRSINGIANRVFALVGGNGVSVGQSTNPHQLTIRVNGAAIQTGDSEVSEESETIEQEDCDPPVDSVDPCDCGEAASEESE